MSAEEFIAHLSQHSSAGERVRSREIGGGEKGTSLQRFGGGDGERRPRWDSLSRLQREKWLCEHSCAFFAHEVAALTPRSTSAPPSWSTANQRAAFAVGAQRPHAHAPPDV